MKTVRKAAVTAGVAATLLTGTPPAAAATGVTFEGSATVGCLGCGSYGPGGNSASFRVYGVLSGTVMTGNAGTATFTVNSPTGVGCLISGTATGSLTVAGDPAGTRYFHWTRIGAWASITITKPGHKDLWGWATFVVHGESVTPCGAKVEADFVGAVS